MNSKKFTGCLSSMALLLAFAPLSHAQSVAPAHGIQVRNMDVAIRPGDDFYDYANGGFIARTKLPADRAAVGVFSALHDASVANIASIIEDAAKGKAPIDANQRKIADLYHSYMNEAAIESQGLSQLKFRLKSIDSISSSRDLANALGLSLRADVDALNNTNFHTANIFGLWVAPGFNDPDHYGPYLLQGGLELPSRDYYLDGSADSITLRNKYRAHIAEMFRLAGYSDVDTRAGIVLDLETQMARQQISLADSENIQKANNVWTQADFSSKAPGIEWVEFFRAAGLEKQPSFIVWQPSAFSGEAWLVVSQSLSAWKNLLAYHLIEAYAAGSSRALADERFAFFGKVLSGTPEQRPRAFRGDALVSSILGDAVGEIYAQRFFSAEAKAAAQQLVANLLVAFRNRLEALPWMAPATKTEALAKLGTLRVGVGYPDKWHSYAGLEIKPKDLFGNLWRSDLFQYHDSLSRIGQPVDRAEWTMTPQTVNAVNLPLDNGLNFPAAILQPPFFDPKAPAAANYGAIGTIIGHEISHTFDSEGAAFDSKGRVRNWWTSEDLAHFDAATAALAAQFDTYKPFPDLAVNGKQTLGENIADVAGVAAALDSFHASLHGQTAPTLTESGVTYTGDQQFFIAFAQNWAAVIRKDALRQQVMTDPHAPGEYRAATVRNVDDWYRAFPVRPTDKLYLAPKNRVHIW